jgi:hypothetical protein
MWFSIQAFFFSSLEDLPCQSTIRLTRALTACFNIPIDPSSRARRRRARLLLGKPTAKRSHEQCALLLRLGLCSKVEWRMVEMEAYYAKTLVANFHLLGGARLIVADACVQS